MTVKELYDACAEMIAKGEGEKEIILYMDEEEFSPIKDGFSSPKEHFNREIYWYGKHLFGYDSDEETDARLCKLS